MQTLVLALLFQFSAVWALGMVPLVRALLFQLPAVWTLGMFSIIFAFLFQFSAGLAFRMVATIVALAERFIANVATFDRLCRFCGCGLGRLWLRVFALVLALGNHLPAVWALGMVPLVLALGNHLPAGLALFAGDGHLPHGMER